MRYLHSQSVVIQLVTLVSSILVLITVLIYNDDTDLCAFNDRSNTVVSLVAKAQRLLDAWHAVLRVIDGDLKLSKCY